MVKLKYDKDIFSYSELRVLNLLPISDKDRGGIASTTIANKLFRNRLNGRVIVIGVIHSLIEKIKHHQQPFRIIKTKRCGPYPVEFWIEKK